MGQALDIALSLIVISLVIVLYLLPLLLIWLAFAAHRNARAVFSRLRAMFKTIDAGPS